MAWSEAARRASALVRRRMAEQKGKFHEYGTPKFDAYYISSAARTKAAQNLRAIRKKVRSGGAYDWGADDTALRSAATTSSMRRHWNAPPRTRPVPKAPASASRGRKSTATEKKNRARSLKIFRQNRSY